MMILTDAKTMFIISPTHVTLRICLRASAFFSACGGILLPCNFFYYGRDFIQMLFRVGIFREVRIHSHYRFSVAVPEVEPAIFKIESASVAFVDLGFFEGFLCLRNYFLGSLFVGVKFLFYHFISRKFFDKPADAFSCLRTKLQYERHRNKTVPYRPDS